MVQVNSHGLVRVRIPETGAEWECSPELAEELGLKPVEDDEAPKHARPKRPDPPADPPTV